MDFSPKSHSINDWMPLRYCLRSKRCSLLMEGRPLRYRLRPSLHLFGSKTHSQNDEDGIVDTIFSDIEPRSRYFVEFGIGPNWQDPDYANGIEGNCVLLRNSGWTGLF